MVGELRYVPASNRSTLARLLARMAAKCVMANRVDLRFADRAAG